MGMPEDPEQGGGGRGADDTHRTKQFRREDGEPTEGAPPADPADALPPGLLFMSYGPHSSQLMGADTHGTGMPDSKGLDVQVEKA